MSKLNYLAASGAAIVLATSLSTAAYAWHPEGKITKEVQNVTSGSAYADANDANSAISAKRGDTLNYRITVVNPAPAASNQYNDLTKINVTDILPAGVTVVSGNKDKNFGSAIVVPQKTAGNGTKSVSYTFSVKVGDTVADKTVICNVAKYTGDSVKNDAPRSGEDKACVKVTVPPVVTPPVVKPPVVTPPVVTPPVEVPQTPQVVEAAELPEVIPSTGAGSQLLPFTGIAAATYAIALFIRTRRS